MKSALFLDRDGTLIQEKNYLSKLEDICFFEDVPQTLKKLKQKGTFCWFLLLLVTNQNLLLLAGYVEDNFVKLCV